MMAQDKHSLVDATVNEEQPSNLWFLSLFLMITTKLQDFLSSEKKAPSLKQ